MIFCYNKLKSGVDEVDKNIAIYETKRREKKWWKALFFYILDISINNASIIYYEQQNIGKNELRSEMYNFRTNLVREFFLQNP